MLLLEFNLPNQHKCNFLQNKNVIVQVHIQHNDAANIQYAKKNPVSSVKLGPIAPLSKTKTHHNFK